MSSHDLRILKKFKQHQYLFLWFHVPSTAWCRFSMLLRKSYLP